ncbi:MAG TPA: phosphoribosylformylglycinamidine cyclo-ligase [Acidimicrobiales bacterium]|nr:phosphoribosylformylglycinamidine cyclo-ligase [Acidimicrobiales bacterium]
MTYAAAGVDIVAGDAAVDAMKDLVRSTYRPEVMGDIGGFGGLFRVPPIYRAPVLVAATDGVGTKLAVAQAVGKLDTVGIDLVAMCVDDLVCQGAEPLFFLDYQAHGDLSPAVVVELMRGIAAGCRAAGCAILGGELAAHPGVLEPGQFDLVGFAVGMVEADEILDGSAVQPGDVLVALLSPGLRSNGYSLARRALLTVAGRRLDEPAWPGAGRTLGEELLEPSVIYTPAVLALLGAVGPDVHALAHITGGGLGGNLPRVLPAGCGAVVRRERWSVPRIFGEVQAAGGVSDEEMGRVFNLGVGMVAVVAPAAATAAAAALEGAGIAVSIIGEVVAGDRGVTLV